MKYEYIILGGSRASLSAIEGIRAYDRGGSILVLSDEDVPAYSRPMLTKTSLANYKLDRTIVYPLSWYKEQGAELHLEEKALSVCTDCKKVKTDKDEYEYEKLIFATGAYNFTPPIPGKDLPQVRNIRKYQDIYDIKRMCVDAKNCVIIGGGVIGLETAFEIARYGVKTTVLEVLPMLMPRFLDEDCAEKLQNAITTFDIFTGVQVAEIASERGGNVSAVKLADGREFPADFVVISTGVRGNISEAQAAGIDCGRAIIIDDHCRTSAKDVYACGDCAESGGINYALWSQAMSQGYAAGANAAGGDEVFEVFDSSMIINSPEISMFSCGDVGKTEGKSYRTEISDNLSPDLFAVNTKYIRAYEKKFYEGDKLVGAIIIGNLSNMQAYKEEILGIKPQEV